MPLPVHQATGTLTSATTGTLTPVLAAHDVGDVIFVAVENANETIALTTDSGFVAVPGSPQGTGTAAGAGSTNLGVFYVVATSNAMPAPVFTAVTDHQSAISWVTRGAIVVGNPWSGTPGADVQAGSDATIEIPGGTTTENNCLVYGICTNLSDNAASRFSDDWANPDLANITTRISVGTASGNGGGIGVFSGEKATAGAYGVSTGTLLATSTQGRMSIAVRGTSAAVSGTVTSNLTEVDVRAGGKTIIITLTNDTWIPA